MRASMLLIAALMAIPAHGQNLQKYVAAGYRQADESKDSFRRQVSWLESVIKRAKSGFKINRKIPRQAAAVFAKDVSERSGGFGYGGEQPIYGPTLDVTQTPDAKFVERYRSVELLFRSDPLRKKLIEQAEQAMERARWQLSRQPDWIPPDPGNNIGYLDKGDIYPIDTFLEVHTIVDDSSWVGQWHQGQLFMFAGWDTAKLRTGHDVRIQNPIVSLGTHQHSGGTIPLFGRADAKKFKAMVSEAIPREETVFKDIPEPKPPEKFRVWKSGKYSVTAKFVELDGSNVRLQKADASIVTVSISVLSESDQQYIKSK